MAWTDFTRAKGWKVTLKGEGGNPWNVDPAKPDILTFEGDGNGGTDDIVRINGNPVGDKVDYRSGTDSANVRYIATGKEYTLTRSASTMTCDPKKSGSRSWTAVEG